jgi:hypothetical protein
MKFRMLMAAAAIAGVMSFASASQAGVYNFLFVGGPVSGSGILTTANDSTTSPTVVSATGMIWDTEVRPNGFQIDGLSLYAGADNIVHPGIAPYVDLSGVSFTTVGGAEFNLGLGGSIGYGYLLKDSLLDTAGLVGVNGATDINLGVFGVPEPGAWALMLAGICGLGLVLRRFDSKALLAA